MLASSQQAQSGALPQLNTDQPSLQGHLLPPSLLPYLNTGLETFGHFLWIYITMIAAAIKPGWG